MYLDTKERFDGGLALTESGILRRNGSVNAAAVHK